MKVFYYFQPFRLEKDKSVVRSIYGDDVIFIRKRPWTVIDLFSPGDIIICNSVDDLVDYISNSITNVDLIVDEYMKIYEKGIDLMFDHSVQCNSLFIKTLESKEQDFVSILRKCVLNYVGQKDIEMKYRRKHVITAMNNGNKVGIKKGTKLTTKKSVQMKEEIRRQSKDFEGTLNDEELMKSLGISRNSFYKYKKEVREGDK